VHETLYGLFSYLDELAFAECSLVLQGATIAVPLTSEFKESEVHFCKELDDSPNASPHGSRVRVTAGSSLHSSNLSVQPYNGPSYPSTAAMRITVWILRPPEVPEGDIEKLVLVVNQDDTFQHVWTSIQQRYKENYRNGRRK
jgi:hypothetical protein